MLYMYAIHVILSHSSELSWNSREENHCALHSSRAGIDWGNGTDQVATIKAVATVQGAELYFTLNEFCICIGRLEKI